MTKIIKKAQNIPITSKLYTKIIDRHAINDICIKTILLIEIKDTYLFRQPIRFW